MRTSAIGLVARSLARSWRNRPIRLIAAIAAGIGGVLLSTAVLLIAVTVQQAVKQAPVEGIADGIVAIEAQAPRGISGDLLGEVTSETGAQASRMLVANTRIVNTSSEDNSVILFGVDPALPLMVDQSLLPADGGVSLFVGDKVVMSRDWATSHGFDVGDTVEIGSPDGLKRWEIADLVDGDFANGGAVVIAAGPAVAQAFDRGDAADVLLLKPEAQSFDETSSAAASVLDGAGQLKPADELFSGYSRTFDTSLSILAMFAAIAIMTSSVVLFLTWRLVLTDARPILSRLKLLGVRTSDLVLGSAAVMIPILLITYVVGAAAGLLVGRQLSAFTTQITNLTQQAFNPGFPLLLPLLGALGSAVVMFGFAWASGLRRLQKVTAIDAVTGRDATVVDSSNVVVPLIGAVIAAVLGVVILVFAPNIVKSVALVPLIVSAGLLSALLPVSIGSVVRRYGSGPTPLFVGRHLQVGWRRNAALSITFAVALVTSVAMSGVSTSIKDEVGASVERWSQVPLYLQSAPTGENLGGETLPIDLAQEIEGVQGVESTYTFSYTNIGIDGLRYPIWSWGGGDVADLTSLRVTDGPSDFIDGLATDEIGVSSNFALTKNLGVGSTLQLPTPTGHRDVVVKAVLDDSASDGGMIVAGDDLFREVVGDSGVSSFGISLTPDADVEAVKQELGGIVAERYPRALVTDADGLRAQFASITSRLVSSFEAFAWVMFALATVVGAATLASGLSERRRAIALTRLVGGTRRGVQKQLALEATVIGVVAWLVAVPGGLLAVPSVISAQSIASGLLPPISIPYPLLLLSLPLTLIAIGIALFVAEKSSEEMPMAQLIAQE